MSYPCASEKAILTQLRKEYREVVSMLNMQISELAEQSRNLHILEKNLYSYQNATSQVLQRNYGDNEVREELACKNHTVYSMRQIVDRLSDEVEKKKKRLSELKILIAEEEEKHPP